jgi:hypothetical protein
MSTATANRSFSRRNCLRRRSSVSAPEQGVVEQVFDRVVGPYCRDRARAEPHYCGRGDLSWALAKVAGASGALAPALLFLVAGWWALTLLGLQRRRHRSRHDVAAPSTTHDG